LALFKDEAGQRFLENNDLVNKMANATHIAWATGGSMVPREIMDDYYKKGISLISGV